MNKRFLGIVALALCGIFAFSACSGTKDPAETTAPTEEETTSGEVTRDQQKEKLYTEVISYNIAYVDSVEITVGYEGQSSADYTIAKRQERLKSLVKYYTPDVLCLQEVNTYWWKYLITDEDSLLNANGYQYVGNTGCFNGKDGKGGKLEFYNLLFYSPERFELVSSGTFWLDTDTTKPSAVYTGTITNTQTDRERMCTYALLKDKLTGTEAVYASTHLNTIGSNEAAVWNRTEAHILISELEKIANGNPVIFCGDMNMTESTATYKLITQTNGYSDARKKAVVKSDLYGTFRSWGKNADWVSGSVIDHCFYKNATAYQYKVLSDTFDKDNNLSTDRAMVGTNYDISDHIGLYIKFVSP